MENKVWTIRYEEYDRLEEKFQTFQIKPFFPEEEDITLMESKISYEMVLFACWLESVLKPKTTEEKYKIKALRAFIEKHLQFVD